MASRSTRAGGRNPEQAGQAAWLATEKVNAELFTLTYGGVLHDYEDCVEEVNKKLDEMGHNIGEEVVAKVALRMFLGIGAAVHNWNAEGTACVVVLETNPLADFVELPERYRALSYCQMLCGVIRGALEMVNMRVECDFSKDALRGDDGYELRLKLLEAGAVYSHTQHVFAVNLRP